MSKPRKPKAPPSRDPRRRSAVETPLARSPGTARELQPKTPPEIIHELQMHQIELEMQNEELKRAHLALEESRDRYLDLYDFAPVGYFAFTRSGRIVEVNLTGAALLGLPREKLVGRGLGSFVVSEDRDRWERHLAGVLQSAAPAQEPGAKQSCELKLEREDGSTFHAHLESVRLDRPEGRESAGAGGESPVIGTALSDITDRRQAEATLRESEEQLRLVLEQSNDAIFWADAETGLIVRCNRKAEEITGRTRDELIGMHQAQLHPADPEYAEVFRQVAALPSAENIEAEVLSRMGKRTPVVINSSVVTFGRKRIIQGIFRDITGYQQAEAALRTASEQRRLALDAAGMGAWDYRFDTGEVFWDERCRNQWGIAQGDQIDYAAAIAAIHPDDRVATDEAVKRAIAGTDGGAYHREFRVVWPDGSEHWVGSRGQLYFEGEGDWRRAVRFIGANRDITERKRMEEAQEFLSRCGYQSSSEDFFQALARYLAQSLRMDFVCIDRLVGDGLAAQTVAMYCDGKFEDNVAYDLKDTPCGDVVGQTICCFPKDVRHLFPKNAVLQEMRAESYVGTILWSFDGKPISLIAVIGRKPLANPRLAESLLKLVAARAAGELERKRAGLALHKAEERLRLAVEAGKMGSSSHFGFGGGRGAVKWCGDKR
jgi:PAS domain S-box-containing protein